MNHLLLSAILVAVACIGLLIASNASAAVNCGGGVTVKGGTPCWKAKRIVKEFKKTRRARVQGFRCSGSTSGGRLVVVNCRLQGKLIHWEA
jgi:ribosomal protein L34